MSGGAGAQHDDESDRAGLGRALRSLRTRAGLDQKEVERRTGISQSQISRAELGRRLLKPEQVAVVADACMATTAEKAELVALAQAAQREYVDARAVLQRGAITFQERVRRLEEDSALVRAYQPGMVLGPLQTPEYARVLFTQRADRPAEEVDRLVANRVERAAQLRNPVRRWDLLQTEGSLLWCLGSPQVMIGQLEHLVEVTRLGHVSLGIIPAFTPVQFTAHHGFHIYDGDAVHVGTTSATALLSRREDVETYAELFGRLFSLAVFGDAARAVLTRLIAEYRKRL